MAIEKDRAAETLEECRRIYLDNLAALYRQDSDLAARIDALPFSRSPKIETARDGNPTVQISGDDGRQIHVHSRYRPVEEAGKFIDSLPAAENPTFFINGLGLGYHLLELARRYAAPVLIVAENNLGLIKTALGVHDFSQIILSNRLILLTSTDQVELHRKLSACNANVLLGLQIVALPHTKRVEAAFHGQMRKILTDFVSIARTQMVTLLKNDRITFKNVAMNMPAYLAHRGIEALENRAAGFPAIVVAAGPSLARNLCQLGALREKAVIIGVQTVLRLLHALGIMPHFVTSLDYHEISTEFFREIDRADETLLVAEPKATWGVLDMFPGGMHVLRHKYYDTLLQDCNPPRGGLRSGTTVAHLAFYVAQQLGCDPIIFVGQDLAFSEGMFYMPGSPIESIWQPELNRFQTLEMKQWERIMRNRPILRETEDIHGRPTYNDELLFTYRQQFENDFAAAPQRIIQASEGGVPLAGAEVMPLAEAARRYCTRPLPATLLADSADPDGPALQARAVEQLSERSKELGHIRKTAREMSGLLEKLEQLVQKPKEFNHLIVRVDALRTLIHKYPRMYRLVIDVSAAAELRRFAADRDIGAPETETHDTARRRLRRDREFVDSFLEGCEFLEQVLPETLNRLREKP